MLILSALFAVLPCCSNDEPEKEIKTKIIGTWDGTAVYSDGRWVDITQYPYTKLAFSATFYKDGTYTGNGSLGNGRGTYVVKGKNVETYVNGKLYFTYKVKTITENKAELTLSDNSSSIDVRVKKRN